MVGLVLLSAVAFVLGLVLVVGVKSKVVMRGKRVCRDLGNYGSGFTAKFTSKVVSAGAQAATSHSVDLLRNHDPTTSLGPFDGNVGAFAELNGEHYFITTNAGYIPALPSLKTLHAVYLRPNMCYGTDDPALWPQQYTPEFCHMLLMAKKGLRPDLEIMWWDPSPADFVVGSAITCGLGSLSAAAFSKLVSPINDLITRCTQLCEKKPALVIPLFGELIEYIVRMLEQVQSLPTTFPKMDFLVTSLQRTFLELDALYEYMSVYKHQMNNYLLAPASQTALPQFVGAFTMEPGIIQQLSAAGIPVWFLRPVIVFDQENILRVVPLSEPSFGLPDDDAHAEGAPAALYCGNSTFSKIRAIRAAAVHTPWYRDPFQTATSSARPRSPSPIPDPSSSRSVTPALTPNIPAEKCHHPYPSKKPPTQMQKQKQTQKQKGPWKVERDKFVLVTDEGMPPAVVSMAQALAKVNHTVVPYTSDDADKRYHPRMTAHVSTPLDPAHRKRGWAARALEECHRYVMRTAALMLDWTTKSARPSIICHVAERHPSNTPEMQALETAVCEYYTQAFWEHFGRTAVLPMRLDHDTEREEGEI
ncbi:hypothetical protein B0H10DRAFT_2250874 [Mycena sp. CBHHK59/15]|nr:hypothetical protein B0H10DRAFT_2250874 [Mycena sp. CBHHK59/15]